MRNLFFVLFCLIPSVSVGEVWTQTLESPDDGAVITVDIGKAMESIESVTLNATGYSIIGGYACDGPEGSYDIPELPWLEATFGQEGGTDDMALNGYTWVDSVEGADFDITHEFDVSDPSVWDFLGDGPIDFSINHYIAYVDPSGFCMHYIGEYRVDTVSLTISFNGTVANDQGSWGALKALYR